MLRKILILLSFLFFFLFSGASAEAKIEQETDPAIIYSDLSGYKLILKSDTDIFIKDQIYSFGFDPGPSFKIATKTNDPRKLIFNVESRLFAGNYTYRVWMGAGPKDYNQSSLIHIGNFRINPPGNINPETGEDLGIPALRVDTTIWKAKSEKTVYIVNAQPGVEYIIWYHTHKDQLFKGSFGQNDLKTTPFNDTHKAGFAVISDTGEATDTRKTLCLTQRKNNAFPQIFTLALSCDHAITGINIVAVLPDKKLLPPSKISNEAGIPTGSPTPIPSVCPKDKCDTALGPISTKPEGFIKDIFVVLLSLAGGVALLLIISSGYRLMASQGNPEAIQKAREQLTSAIIGLLFIIFSLSILQIIGVDILQIPGLER